MSSLDTLILFPDLTDLSVRSEYASDSYAVDSVAGEQPSLIGLYVNGCNLQGTIVVIWDILFNNQAMTLCLFSYIFPSRA